MTRADPVSAPILPLVVDLDGTLIRSDMLYESFWSALSRRWMNAVPIMGGLAGGRAALKQTLAGLSSVDVASLPYNQEVVDYVRRWRNQGGRTALVTATDQGLAERIADELDLFDEVRGSDGDTNLKGFRKAEFLEQRFGRNGFVYMGDAPADLAIWEKAARAVTVDVSPRIRTALAAIPVESDHLRSRSGLARPLLKALRPHQWLKNILIFLPILTAHSFGTAAIGQALLAFIAFCMTASSVYLLNDLLDLAADRAHPRKRLRPFASGSLPLSYGTILAPALLLAGLLLSALLGSPFLLVMLGYYAVTMAYSFDLKRRLIVDICALAGLYTLRIVAGGAATGTPLSVWLLAFSIFFFFSLAAVKRQAELVSSTASGQKTAHGRGYLTEDLPLVANMSTAAGYVSVLVMVLYINSNAVQALYVWPEPLWGICLVLLYWISRMVMITHRGQMHDDPIVFAARDRNSLICGGLVLLLAGIAA